jgi:hypothetical protein
MSAILYCLRRHCEFLLRIISLHIYALGLPLVRKHGVCLSEKHKSNSKGDGGGDLILPGFVTAGTADAEWMNFPLFLEPEHQETVHPHIRAEPVEECANEDLRGVVDIMYE